MSSPASYQDCCSPVLVAILKVVDVDISYHSYAGYESEDHGEPYTQISIGGFILLEPEERVFFANVQIAEEYGFTEKVRGIKECLAPGSLHRVESASHDRGEADIFLYNPQFTLLDTKGHDATNALFPIAVAEGRDPGDDEFYYAGVIYKEGKGKFMGFKRRGEEAHAAEAIGGRDAGF